WGFALWQGLRFRQLVQPHSDSNYLAEHFGFLTIAHDPDRHRRKRVRLQDDAIALDAAPAADVAFTGFDEVDWPFVFSAPCARRGYLVLRLVDLHKCSRQKQRIHRVVFRSDIAVREPTV